MAQSSISSPLQHLTSATPPTRIDQAKPIKKISESYGAKLSVLPPTREIQTCLLVRSVAALLTTIRRLRPKRFSKFS